MARLRAGKILQHTHASNATGILEPIQSSEQSNEATAIFSDILKNETSVAIHNDQLNKKVSSSQPDLFDSSWSPSTCKPQLKDYTSVDYGQVKCLGSSMREKNETNSSSNRDRVAEYQNEYDKENKKSKLCDSESNFENMADTWQRELELQRAAELVRLARKGPRLDCKGSPRMARTTRMPRTPNMKENCVDTPQRKRRAPLRNTTAKSPASANLEIIQSKDDDSRSYFQKENGVEAAEDDDEHPPKRALTLNISTK